MKDAKIFVDTNILVYGYDTSAGEKYAITKKILKDLWDTSNGLISTQVLQEFFVTVTRKIAKPMDATTAKEIVKDFLKWKTVVTNGTLILEAIDIHHKHLYSFWDSLIIASAIDGGATTILSEDLSDKQKIKGIVIKNPFHTSFR
ncbi:MAG: PIN domain-containing protein [Proteobacteria bacterium]|nr:PIN domain-containing protein [Pseudomonadota bacterium]